MEFDLPTYLREMKADLQEDMRRIESKVDDCLQLTADHEVRLSVMDERVPEDNMQRLISVEGTVQRSMRIVRWAASTVIGAGITAAIGYIVSLFQGASK